MSNKFKGLVASLACATSMISASGPASAQTFASLGLDQNLGQCDQLVARRALSINLEIPENLSGVTDLFCGCEVVSVEMLEFIRKHSNLEVLLDQTSQQCPGFARVLTNVSTASTGLAAGEGSGSNGNDGGRPDYLVDDTDHRGSNDGDGGGTSGGGTSGGDGGGTSGGGTSGGDGGGTSGGGTSGGTSGGGTSGGDSGSTGT